MKPLNTPVEPYKYFWLHVKQDAPPERKLFFGQAPDIESTFGDGDHWVARVIEYCIGQDGDILVILGPIWRVQSNDGSLKWHQTGWKKDFWYAKFTGCVQVGEPGKERARFKTGTELLIFSSSEHDRALIEELVSEAS